MKGFYGDLLLHHLPVMSQSERTDRRATFGPEDVHFEFAHANGFAFCVLIPVISKDMSVFFINEDLMKKTFDVCRYGYLS